MGELIIKKWQCDRCKAILDTRPSLNTRYNVCVYVELDFQGGPEIIWKDMCGPCNRKVEEQIEQMKRVDP